MLKRICAFCLILALTVSLVAALPVSAASDSDIKMVADLGIIDISQSGGILPEVFSRSDFARSLCLMERNDNPPKVSAEEAAVYASDIATNAKSNFIAAVLSAGYMKTDSEGKFNPSASISLSDAVTALVKMLGYEPMAQANGGTDDAYYKIALKIGIMKGVSVKDNKKLTNQETAEILTNTMGAKMLVSGKIDNGEDCLWDRWDVYVHTGKILANSNMGLLVGKTEPGYVNISGTEYPTDLLVENEIVGSNVTYYTMPSDMGDKVVSIYVKEYGDTITLKPYEIQSISDNGNILTIKTDDKEQLKVDKKGFLIVNGNTMSPSIAMFNAFESGMATFVDSDNNGTYDVIHMTLLFQTVIDGVNVEANTLATRYDNQVINLEKIDTYEVYLDDKKATLADLYSGMTVGIACDSYSFVEGELVLNFTNAKYVGIYASRRQQKGSVTAMIDADTFEIDELPKSYGSGYKRLVTKGHISALRLGDSVTAYYDNLGQLTYFELNKEGGLQYGYLVAAASSGSLRKATEVRILGTDGVFNIYSTGSNFVLDGARVESGATVYTVNTLNDVDLTKRQLIRYRVEDGVLKEIDTAVVRASSENKETSLDAALPFDPTAEGNSTRRVRAGAIDRRHAFSDDCIVFIDEADINEARPNDNSFSVANVKNLTNGSYYIGGYDSNLYNEMSCVVRYEGYVANGEASTKGLEYSVANCYIVEKVTNTLINDDWGWKLTLAGDSNKGAYYVSPNDIKLYTTRSAADWSGDEVTIYKENADNLSNVIKPGDIIRFQTNAAGNITYIEKMFDFASHKDTFAEVPNKGGQTYGFAKLEAISGINFIYSYGDEDDRFISRSATKYTAVPLYHVSTGEVEMLPLAQIPSAITGNNVKCFIRYYSYGTVRDNIFYIYD